MAEIVHGGQAEAHPEEHRHPPFLAHHFDNPAQQFDAGKLGMWIFLATEVLFFGGLFCFYSIYRRNHPEIFLEGHRELSVFWGAVNTIILLCSSFTMALGVYCAQKSNRPGLIVCLALTLAGAAGFMVVKAIEYAGKYQHGVLWGKYYNPHKKDHAAASPATASRAGAGHEAQSPPAGGTNHAAGSPPAGPPAPPTAGPPSAESAAPFPEKTTLAAAGAAPSGIRPEPADGHGSEHGGLTERAKNLHIFFSIYFCLTGLHGLHVLGGMVVLTILLIGAVRGLYNSEYYTPVDLGGLYWHLVDLIWIYLFPLLYLIH
jgi:cytochrome c oxidase subunit 3